MTNIKYPRAVYDTYNRKYSTKQFPSQLAIGTKIDSENIQPLGRNKQQGNNI